MSYHVSIYPTAVGMQARTDPSVTEKIRSLPEIPATHRAAFISRLKLCGYVREPSASSLEMVKFFGKTPVTVSFHAGSVTFSVPFWADADEAIFEACMTASDLADSPDYCVFDAQKGEWQFT